jgi:hypothetical protein
MERVLSSTSENITKDEGTLPTCSLENLEIVELENSEGHFEEVFKEMML